MGKVLQIRVSATTPFPEEIQRFWPGLTELAWPKGPPEVPDLLGLTQALYDQYRLSAAKDQVWSGLASGLTALHQVQKGLEQALADWQPQAANQASDRLEDILDELESIATD